MFEVFNYENVKTVLNKKPLICYYSETGACGPSGMMLVIFDDKSDYGYSAYYDKSDKKLISLIAQYVPELASLLLYGDKVKIKRKSYQDEMTLFYLGLGNHAYIHNSLVKEEVIYFPEFIKLVKQISDVDVKDMHSQIKESINGHL